MVSGEPPILYDLSEQQRALLLRMLAVLARADDEVAAVESHFLRLFMSERENEDMGRVIRAIVAPTSDEIRSLMKDRGEAVYRLCAMMVCTDARLTDEEIEILGSYGKALDLTIERAATLLDSARSHVLESKVRQMATSKDDEERKLAALSCLAQELAIPDEEIDAVIMRYQSATAG